MLWQLRITNGEWNPWEGGWIDDFRLNLMYFTLLFKINLDHISMCATLDLWTIDCLTE